MFTHYYCGTNIDVRQFWGYCRIILPSINNAFVSQVNRVANFSCNINFIGVFITENYNLSGYNRMLYWFTYLQGRNRGITNDNSENQKIKTTFVPPSTNIVDCDFIVMQLKVSIAIYLYPPKPCHCPINFFLSDALPIIISILFHEQRKFEIVIQQLMKCRIRAHAMVYINTIF